MSHQSVLDYGDRIIPNMRGKRVLEVGSYDINGSLRPMVELMEPEVYIGVDLELGPKVDKIVEASSLVKEFGLKSFDLVICSEMLEHAEDWRTAVNQIKAVARTYILVTTRSEGFPYHGFPHDNWRYSKSDLAAIFSDWEIISLEDDPEYPGVMMLARSDLRKKLVDLNEIELTPAPDKPHWH